MRTKPSVAQLQLEGYNLRLEVESLKADRTLWLQKQESWHKEYDRLCEERDRAKAESEANKAITAKLIEQITVLANRSIPAPEVIQPDIVRIIEAVGEAFAKSFVGYGMQADPNATITPSNPQAMFESEPEGVFIPDHEIDEGLFPGILDQEVLPTKGGFWNPGNPPPPDLEHPPAHTITNGRVQREDGTPMFRQGQGAPPPKGGME